MTTTNLDALEAAWAATTPSNGHDLVDFGTLAYKIAPALIADNRRLRAENEAMREVGQ